jgi:hypothetical protein
MPAKIKLASVAGVVVHKRTVWPYGVYVSGTGHEEPVTPETVLNTVQTAVYEELVAGIVKKILAGEWIKDVEAVKIGGRLWVTDGHHTMTAYKQLGVPFTLFVYDTSGGSYLMAAPKLFRWKKLSQREKDFHAQEYCETPAERFGLA